MTRYLLPLSSRPGVDGRDHAAAECGCDFIVTADQDVAWTLCAAHEDAPAMVRLLRAAKGNVARAARPETRHGDAYAHGAGRTGPTEKD
jgi:hypothetical protein